MANERPVYLGPRLRRLRRDLGLTQAHMAGDLDISASYVALLERNQRPLTADLLMRLARTYRLDLADLAMRLEPLGQVRRNDFALRFVLTPYELTIFPDGRAIIKGTTDVGVARSLYARYVGS